VVIAHQEILLGPEHPSALMVSIATTIA